MHNLFNLGRTLLTRCTIKTATRRRLGTGLVCLLGSSMMAQSQVLARKTMTVDLSPLISQSTIVSPTDATKEISVVLVLPLRDAKGAAEFAQRVSTPKDELYGKYLTPPEFAARYGADAGDYAAVKSWATSNGLKVSDESVSRTTLMVRGSVAEFEALFNTQINNYRAPDGQEFYSAGSKPVVPNSISAKVMGVIGLTGGRQYAPLAQVYKKFGENPATELKTDTAGGNGPGGSYNAADVRNAYSISQLSGATVSQSVAVFEQGGFAAGDVTKYLKTNNLPDVPIKVREVNAYGGAINDPGVELEAVLDIDMIIGINPAVKEVFVYEDGFDFFSVALLDALTDVANDNKVQTLSISYGDNESKQGDTQLAAEGQVLTQLAAQGINVFASSGDGGAYGRLSGSLNVEDPGSQPFVTCVGGTTLYTIGPKCARLDEEVWNLMASGYGATGGGVSIYWPIPPWQPSETSNGGSATYRNVPDVAAVANPLTGVGVYSKINGGWVQVGGTSVSAPLWAGYISLLNSLCKTVGIQPVGFFNPTLYQIGNNYPGSTTLNDIVTGNNSDLVDFPYTPGYTAGFGYDNCSGFGSMVGGAFAWQLLTTLPAVTGHGPGFFEVLSAKPQTTTVQVSWQPSKGATGYLVTVLLNNLFGNSVAYAASSGTSVEITGLAPNTTYYVLATALNPKGFTGSGYYYQPGIYFTTKK